MSVKSDIAAWKQAYIDGSGKDIVGKGVAYERNLSCSLLERSCKGNDEDGNEKDKELLNQPRYRKYRHDSRYRLSTEIRRKNV